METTAVYWEPKIRTYGFQIEKELSLLEIRLDPSWPDTGPWPEKLESSGFRFSLIFGQVRDSNSISLYIAARDSSMDQLMEMVGPGLGIRDGDCSIIASPVDMLSFQGPHYGDRPGIAYKALETLCSGGMNVIALCCSVSCIYIILEQDKGEAARDILLENFEVPLKNRRRRNLKKQ